MIERLINEAVIQDFSVSERMKVYEASYKFDIKDAPAYDYFQKILENISVRDQVKITLQDCNERVFDFSKHLVTEDAYTRYISDTLDDEIVDVRIRIDKKVKERHFSIYNFREFANDILSLSLEEVMISFSNLFKESTSMLIFDVYSSIPMFATKTMFFMPHDAGDVNTEFNRVQRIEVCKETAYFYNFDVYEILPDDFKIDINYTNNPLDKIFQRISTLLSIGFIATSATIDDGQIKGIVSGQRTVDYSCNIDDLSYNPVLYGVYNWIYTDGNAIDKAIIARNVISLHCKYSAIVDIDNKVMSSIQSNYNLYLKENVKEYLELKNRVAEFISEILSKTGEYATILLDKFKSNIIAIFGFLFTVILANIVSDQPLDNIFTNDITIILECILGGSFVYLIICYLQSKYEIEKVYYSYEQLRKNYDEILPEDDLHEIFGNDELLNEMKLTIQKSGRTYLVMWVIFLIVLFVIIERISQEPTYIKIVEFIKNIDFLNSAKK